MNLFLQFGFGMMEHCRRLVSNWGDGTVVLSPRDLDSTQLLRLSEDLASLGGRVLLDPQFFLPHSDHERLRSHDYWPEAYETALFWQGNRLRELLSKLASLNAELGTEKFILPGLLAATVDDDWLESQRAILEEARALEGAWNLVQTVALSADAARNEEQVARLLEWAERDRVQAYYIVAEHPGGDYLVKDPVWLVNMLDMIAGFKLLGSEVIVGYCNHQMLVAAAAKADAICSGTWMNVRSFPPAKFSLAYQEEIRRRASWFYCPQALSEYTVPFLDIARLQGVLDLLSPPPEFDGGYTGSLFEGAQPSTVGLSEQSAFRHYLHCLRGQTLAAGQSTFDDTVISHESILTAAEELIGELISRGVRGHLRDFGESVDANRAALSVLRSTRGPILRRRWTEL